MTNGITIEECRELNARGTISDTLMEMLLRADRAWAEER